MNIIEFTLFSVYAGIYIAAALLSLIFYYQSDYNSKPLFSEEEMAEFPERRSYKFQSTFGSIITICIGLFQLPAIYLASQTFGYLGLPSWPIYATYFIRQHFTYFQLIEKKRRVFPVAIPIDVLLIYLMYFALTTVF